MTPGGSLRGLWNMFLGGCLVFLGFAGLLCHRPALGAGLPDTVARVRPSIVAVGTYQAMRRPPSVFLGTGFAVADGRHVITNAHVIPEKLDKSHRERLAVFVGRGRRVQVRTATPRARDDVHDLVVLQIRGSPLPPLRLSHAQVREGEPVAFTGFPIGMVLGLYPVTHRGIISAVSPLAIPTHSGRSLDRDMVVRLKKDFDVYQLDATAYPGNSGSPLYRPDNGQVLGVINKVLVTHGKEKMLERPSGITFAVPVQHVRALLRKAGIQNP
ncbi:Trypsin-like peptidase domain-containing protein [Desulfacinum hydrothermale DSM 13146]|uniref:Trypsin-like peptidase domain-containing protein n=1 Tax=Desulfacinum hydrothermale DSM 13146 TaxID=1121390 RepID=A0A1W1XAX8_9BACT|nr:serine protease [Desulfacinum hydrothermale]SMC21019.1 Trypsin-like peptidase domain-containing protein [Desulfacinum hydrothermale DSM 13146]